MHGELQAQLVQPHAWAEALAVEGQRQSPVGVRIIASRIAEKPDEFRKISLNTGAEGPAPDARPHVRGSAAGAADCHRIPQRRPWGLFGALLMAAAPCSIFLDEAITARSF